MAVSSRRNIIPIEPGMKVHVFKRDKIDKMLDDDGRINGIKMWNVTLDRICDKDFLVNKVRANGNIVLSPIGLWIPFDLVEVPDDIVEIV